MTRAAIFPPALPSSRFAYYTFTW